MKCIPNRYRYMLERSLQVIKDPGEREILGDITNTVAEATWKHWLAWRLPEDNLDIHEFVVLANMFRIAEAEILSLEEKKVAIGFCCIHDTYYIRRIMENEIVEAREAGDLKLAEHLTEEKRKQRIRHMKGGAINARFLLEQLEDPHVPGKQLYSRKEIERCTMLVASHDLWKVSPPTAFPTRDRLALCCTESDMLFPITSGTGPLADLFRPNEHGCIKDITEPSAWKKQLDQSLRTLTDARQNWLANKLVDESDFKEKRSVFRTAEGARLFTSWCEFWGI